MNIITIVNRLIFSFICYRNITTDIGHVFFYRIRTYTIFATFLSVTKESYLSLLVNPLPEQSLGHHV